jgi:hypothetical protein
MKNYYSKFNLKNKINLFKIFNFFSFKLLLGDWGLGIGDWGLGIGPNPQSPIPNPQSP